MTLRTKLRKGATGGRRKIGEENIRSLTRTSGGKSYAITLPVAVIRAFRWEKRQKLELTVDAKKKRITISDWPKRSAGSEKSSSNRPKK